MEGCGLGITVEFSDMLGDSVGDIFDGPVGLGVGLILQLAIVLVGEFL